MKKCILKKINIKDL